MPTYGYRCTECAQQFEVFQKITDDPLAACQSCGGPVKRILYPVGIQFKGSGFYVNDYTKNGGKAPEKKEADSGAADKTQTKDAGDSAAASPPAATETKTETKPETKTEAKSGK